MTNPLIGDSRRIYARFYDYTVDPPVLTDPASVIFEVKANAGVTVTYTYGVSPEVVKENTGIYYLFLTLPSSGKYWIYCKGAGIIFAVGQMALLVDNKQT
jgi:hypothetical protein